jgi:chromosome segregation ATPase
MGESNIADAILWCLGEQSPKTLRGDRMEDVLFNGSAQRAPTGLPRWRSPERRPPGRARRSGRRVYRDHHHPATLPIRESEYLINRVPWLKDVRDLLIETGAGAKGHTVLEQGKVDAIINASPLERRALVEETAGITKYKIRKTEALRKLDSTEQNLLRVRDIMGEVKRQLSSLDRQAKKAERYRQTYDELKALELRAATTRFQEWSAQAAELSSAVDRERVEEARLLADLGSIEATVEARKAELGDLDRHHQEAQAQHVGGETRAQDARHRLDFLAAQTEEWRGQREALVAELEALARALVDRRDEAARYAVEWESAEAATKDDEALVASGEEAVQAFEQHLAHAAADIEQTRHRIFEALSGIAAATNALTTLASRREELEKRRVRYEDEIGAARAEILQKHTVHQNLEAAHLLHAQSLASRRRNGRPCGRLSGTAGRPPRGRGGPDRPPRRPHPAARHADSLAALQRDRRLRRRRAPRAPRRRPNGRGRAVGGGRRRARRPPIMNAQSRRCWPTACRASWPRTRPHHGGGRGPGRPQRRPRHVRPARPAPRCDGVAPNLPALSEIHGAARDLVGCRQGLRIARGPVGSGCHRDRPCDCPAVLGGRPARRDVGVGLRRGVRSSGVVSGGAARAGLSLLERKRTIKALEVDVKNAEDASRRWNPRSLPSERARWDRRTLGQLDDELREGQLRLVHDQKAAEAVAQEILQLDRRLTLLTLEEDAAGKEITAMAASVAEMESALSSHEDTKAREERSLLAQYEAASRLKGALTEATGAVTDARLGWPPVARRSSTSRPRAKRSPIGSTRSPDSWPPSRRPATSSTPGSPRPSRNATV